MRNMGPRKRRRVTAAIVGLGLIAAVVVGIVLLTGKGNSGRHTSGRLHHVSYTIRYLPGGDAQYIAHYHNLPYGLTKQQVRRLVGPPTKIANNCWQYPVHEVYSDGYTEKTDKLCFYDGRYTQKYIQGSSGVWNAY